MDLIRLIGNILIESFQLWPCGVRDLKDHPMVAEPLRTKGLIPYLFSEALRPAQIEP